MNTRQDIQLLCMARLLGYKLSPRKNVNHKYDLSPKEMFDLQIKGESTIFTNDDVQIWSIGTDWVQLFNRGQHLTEVKLPENIREGLVCWRVSKLDNGFPCNELGRTWHFANNDLLAALLTGASKSISDTGKFGQISVMDGAIMQYVINGVVCTMHKHAPDAKLSTWEDGCDYSIRIQDAATPSSQTYLVSTEGRKTMRDGRDTAVKVYWLSTVDWVPDPKCFLIWELDEALRFMKRPVLKD